MTNTSVVRYDNDTNTWIGDNGTPYTGDNGTTYTGTAWVYPYVERWYPVYYTTWCDNKSTVEQSFNIVQKLMEKEIIKKLTLKQFIEIVNEIAKLLRAVKNLETKG